MKKLRGLVISWYYPPGNSSEGLVTYKLLKNSKFEYDVFTRKPFCGSMWDRQTDESNLTAENVTVYQADSTNAVDWVEEAVEFFEDNKDKYDFIMSRVMPVDSHVAAAKIKAKFPDVKWVASFGDPLFNSPYIEYIEREENPFYWKEYLVRERPSLLKSLKLLVSPTRRARKKVWEKERQEKMVWPLLCEKTNDETFAKADLLVFNNQYQLDRAFQDNFVQYRDKGVIINHGFDEKLYPKTKPNHGDSRKHFLYVGHLDEMRNAKPILRALGHLARRDKDLSKKVRFDFYGHMSEGDKAAIIDNKLGEIVKVHGDITYTESLGKIAEADWLVLIDANLNAELNEYIYFPAKLVDYIGARKPILAMTQIVGTSADTIRRLKAGQVVSHDADDIYLYLSKIIHQDYNPAEYDLDELTNYNAVEVAKKFDRVVTELVDE